MSINISFTEFATSLAERTISWQQPPVSDDRKRQILPATMRNRMVEIFNGSTVLLGISFLSVLLISAAVAVVFGSIALCVRSIVQNELLPKVQLRVTKAELDSPVFELEDRNVTKDMEPLERATITGTLHFGRAPKALLTIFGHVLWRDKEELPPIRPNRLPRDGLAVIAEERR